MSLILPCPACDHQIDLTALEAGQAFACPSCERVFESPAALGPKIAPRKKAKAFGGLRYRFRRWRMARAVRIGPVILRKQKQKYGVLESVAVLLKVFAVIVFLLGFISWARLIDNPIYDLNSSGLGYLLGLIVFIIISVAMWAFAELIELLIDIEANTRGASNT